MKKISVLLLSFLLLASLAACAPGTKATPDETVVGISQETATDTTETEAPAEPLEEAVMAAAPVANADPLLVADASRFVGTVEEFAVNEQGQTVLMMRRAVGSRDPKKFQAVLTEDTRYNFDSTEMGNGAFLEIYYGSSSKPEEVVTAIAINTLMSEDLTSYNGTLVSVTPNPEKEGSGQLLLDPIDQNGMQFAFNYQTDTQFYLDFKALKPGDQLHILHSAAATRSIPPQSAALEISPYQAPDADELKTPAFAE